MEQITITETEAPAAQIPAPSITELDMLRFQAALQIYCVQLTTTPEAANQEIAVSQANLLLETLGLVSTPTSAKTTP